jgi:SAM-dependent methyltransferase
MCPGQVADEHPGSEHADGPPGRSTDRYVRLVTAARYDAIGNAYAANRREDPRLRERIHLALADSRTVVNVGAGTGSYEPRDRYVVAVEPSEVMAAQRPAELAAAIRGTAAPLVLRDGSVDAAMAILTIHHWDDQLEAGVRELRRVARGPVVIVTVDAEVCGTMWLLRDYLPEVAALDRATFPPVSQLAAWLGGTVEVETILTARDTPDWTLASFWAHPERVLDETARSSTSGFARMTSGVVDRVVADVTRDLRDGTWDARNGHLRELRELDVGMRLVIAHP